MSRGKLLVKLAVEKDEKETFSKEMNRNVLRNVDAVAHFEIWKQLPQVSHTEKKYYLQNMPPSDTSEFQDSLSKTRNIVANNKCLNSIEIKDRSSTSTSCVPPLTNSINYEKIIDHEGTDNINSFRNFYINKKYGIDNDENEKPLLDENEKCSTNISEESASCSPSLEIRSDPYEFQDSLHETRSIVAYNKCLNSIETIEGSSTSSSCVPPSENSLSYGKITNHEETNDINNFRNFYMKEICSADNNENEKPSDESEIEKCSTKISEESTSCTPSLEVSSDPYEFEDSLHETRSIVADNKCLNSIKTKEGTSTSTKCEPETNDINNFRNFYMKEICTADNNENEKPSDESENEKCRTNISEELSSRSPSLKIRCIRNQTLKNRDTLQPVNFLNVINAEKLPRNNNFQNVLRQNLDKNLCPFCFENVGHFARHLFRNHSDEEEIKKISKMPIKSNNRRTAITALRKKGNFILKQEHNELKPLRQMRNHYQGIENVDINDKEYFPCITCLGYYKKSYLWRHRKTCQSNTTHNSNATKKQHLTESQTFLATTGLLGNYLNKSRLKKEVFSIMRADQISYTAKSDSLICLFGESYLNKHKRQQMNVVVSNKMRELARLKIAIQQSSTITNFIDILKPEMYNRIITATKVICGYDAETYTYKASSLALHLGTNLKFICDVARKAIVTKDPLFVHLNRIDTNKEILELRDMISNHWCNDISSLANKVLNEYKSTKPKLLPVTEDILAFNKYVTNLAEKAFEMLVKNEDIANNYKTLTECTLSMVLVFNRKRVGEVQFLDIETYERDYLSLNQEECLNSLSELEKAMSATFKRVVVFGKGSKPVPILFTKRMQKYIELLLKFRNNTKIVPESNKYIFANPGISNRWMSGPSVLRKFALKCGAKHPELLTSTRFRKQIATILQLTSFENDEMEQIARFMGHTEKTHREFYRLTDDIYQTAKVAKVLLLLNAGKGSEFKGMSLAEIHVNEDIVDYECNGSDDEQSNEKLVNELVPNNTDNNFNVTSSLVNEIVSNSENGNCTATAETANNISNSEKDFEPKKSNRIRWSKNERNIVLKYFKKNIKSKIVPKKEDCLNLIRRHSDLFTEKDWIRIKTLVYNTYRNT